MEVQSFNAELAIANLMFLRLFNNIIIQRTNAKGETSPIKINCVLGQRSRIFKNWQNAEKRAAMKLPMIAINRTGYTRNSERLNNLHNEVKYEITSKNRSYDLLTPIPIDISYDVVVMAKYPSDIDQIASNFMIMFNSDIYMSCQHPKYEGIKLNNQIIMSDSVTEEHPDELDGSTNDFITTSFQFTFKTYLFGGKGQAKLVPQTVLSTVTSSFMSSYIHEFDSSDMDEIEKYLEDNSSARLSAIMTKPVTADIQISVVNPDLSTNIYDGFVPTIHSFEVGFYPVPHQCDYAPYMQEVDTYIEQWPYVDRVVWQI